MTADSSRAPTDPFPLTHKLHRLLWRGTWFVLASWTPPQLAAWRRMLLRLFGAKMGPRSDVRGSARIWHPPYLTMEATTILASKVDCYNQAPVTIREGATVSQGAHLCAGSHDADREDFQHVARPIEIGAGAWIAAEAFVGPGVTVGEQSVLGARAVAFKSLEPGMIYVGNPARPIRPRRFEV